MGHDAVGHCFIKEIRKIYNIVTPRNVPCFSLSIYANWCGFSLTAAPRRLAQLVIALLQGASTRQNFRPRYQQQVANAQAQTLVFLGQ